MAPDVTSAFPVVPMAPRAMWQLAVVLGTLWCCKTTLANELGAQSYVVVLKRGAGQAQVDAICAEAAASNYGRFNGLCSLRFSHVLNGFAGMFEAKDLRLIRTALGDALDHIERDHSYHVAGDAHPEWIEGDSLPASARERRQLFRTTHAGRRRGLPEQAGADWDLDRIDQQSGPLDGVYHYDHLGTGVNVYMLDTGIRLTHNEFRSQRDASIIRARPGFSAFGDNMTNDCNGHGTHTAATVGGLTYGVAKNVTLWAIRAMDCQGDAQVSNILAAFEWIAKNHVSPAVVSMSVAGDLSPAVNEAARRLVEENGVVVVAAAGNEYAEACTMSPASAPSVIAVGASDENDKRWAQSNFGACVDIHAPGVSVLSAVNTSDTDTRLKTGTSMATPHVSGVVALYLETHPGASPVEIRQKINSAAVLDSLSDDVEGYGTWNPAASPLALDISDTPNRLLQSVLSSQATFTPGVITLQPGSGPSKLNFMLQRQPSLPVTIDIAAPEAEWAGMPLVDIQPASIIVQPNAWNITQFVSMAPTALADGDFHINFTFSSQDPYFDNALQTVKVLDGRQLTGDTIAAPRIITKLPFMDTDDSSRFTDQYTYATGDPPGSTAPDVVYRYTAVDTQVVEISTCGSTFDTKLYVFNDPSQLPYTGNDDASCAGGNKASRVTTTLVKGQSYWIVVDGFSSGWTTAQGLYTLTVAPDTSTY